MLTKINIDQKLYDIAQNKAEYVGLELLDIVYFSFEKLGIGDLNIGPHFSKEIEDKLRTWKYPDNIKQSKNLINTLSSNKWSGITIALENKKLNLDANKTISDFIQKFINSPNGSFDYHLSKDKTYRLYSTCITDCFWNTNPL